MKDLLRACFKGNWDEMSNLAHEYTDPDKFATLARLAQHKGNRDRLFELGAVGNNTNKKKPRHS